VPTRWLQGQEHEHVCVWLCGMGVVQVRMAALNGLVVLCELLPHEARVAHLLPLVRRHMQPLELELPLQRTLAAAFPRLLAAVRSLATTRRLSQHRRKQCSSTHSRNIAAAPVSTQHQAY